MSRLKFVKSATQLSHFPEDDTPEIALAGRSNAGKSSVINLLSGSRLAKVSGTPGKTRLLNLFDHKFGYRIVDMPGYGYASRSHKEQGEWRDMIEAYLNTRENLKALCLIMDVRREWTDDEQQLLKWSQMREIDFAVVLTKMDKLSRGKAMSIRQKLIQKIQCPNVLLVSNLKKVGLKEFEDLMNGWAKSAPQKPE